MTISFFFGGAAPALAAPDAHTPSAAAAATATVIRRFIDFLRGSSGDRLGATAHMGAEPMASNRRGHHPFGWFPPLNADVLSARRPPPFPLLSDGRALRHVDPRAHDP